ncbi:MAG: FeoB-associated Cys-rich membrane protein [Desulfobacteraceae bacterium]
MEKAGTIVVTFIVCLAAFYLYRHFAAKLKQAESPCGCGGCAGCAAKAEADISDCINDSLQSINRKSEINDRFYN